MLLVHNCRHRSSVEYAAHCKRQGRQLEKTQLLQTNPANTFSARTVHVVYRMVWKKPRCCSNDSDFKLDKSITCKNVPLNSVFFPSLPSYFCHRDSYKNLPITVCYLFQDLPEVQHYGHGISLKALPVQQNILFLFF